MSKPKIRTIAGALKFLKEDDPETPITRSMIESAIEKGDIPCIRQGNRKFVLLNTVYEYFYKVPITED